MSKVLTHQLSIPNEAQQGWQNIVNLLAEIVNVPAALVMRLHPKHIEVFSCNNNVAHPYSIGEREPLDQGLYCETVVESQHQLLVPNAIKDPQWENNPDIKLGMIAYCGLPLSWPNGEAFGTICVLDTKENHYSKTYQDLLLSFKQSIESQLATLYKNEELKLLNAELKSRVTTRTQDLVQLNYSLNLEIDKRRAAEQRIQYQQKHDLGTGFLNRAALEYQCQNRFSQLDSKQELAAIHIAFTNGRQVQHKHGHGNWERVLMSFRDRVVASVSDDLLFARPTTTDITILVAGNPQQPRLLKLCQTLVDVSHSEYQVEHETIHLHAYMGVATSDTAENGHHLLKQASEAMHVSKDSGHKYSFFAKGASDAHKHISQLESYLLQAVRNDDLLLYFQPKVSPTTHRWTGAEALLRWRHPLLGDISNETLIHLAEQNGLIFEVGSFVLRNAIEKASVWAERVNEFKIAINLSAVQLRNPQLVEQIRDLLDAYQLSPTHLELEITESGLIADEVIARNTLSALHDIGITLSLDDFGTGYSSFNYLKKFPFDAIKVDKSFIHQLDKCEEDKEIVRSIISVAKKLNLAVTVEGVENQSHEDFILEQGCEYGQGYYYGKPMPCDEFESHLYDQQLSNQQKIRYQ
ncbi:sensor domain-containing phosphodiesterase [Vibrio sonorensis]|uniref:sensor domain-containing phosphodiesterase n=1 Tax=Vibrio sonorensis TaxID=1004316 RepID=UPI0008DA739E|nr:EAL domain-containing protein [Vibrio sonorensis]